MTGYRTIAAAMALLAFSNVSHAALVNYDEAVDGDLPNFNDVPLDFLLDTAGLNSWRGSSTTPTPNGTYELDYFNAILGAGMKITDYSLSITNIQELPDSSPGAINALTRITALDLVARYATLQVGDTTEATNPIPLPWTDSVAVRTSYARGGDTYFSWDWEVTLTTAPINGTVPLPAGLPLLASALAGVALLRRKHRTAG